MTLEDEFRKGLETLSPEIAQWAQDQDELEDALKHAPCRGGSDCTCPSTLYHYRRVLREHRAQS